MPNINEARDRGKLRLNECSCQTREGEPGNGGQWRPLRDRESTKGQVTRHGFHPSELLEQKVVDGRKFSEQIGPRPHPTSSAAEAQKRTLIRIRLPTRLHAENSRVLEDALRLLGHLRRTEDDETDLGSRSIAGSPSRGVALRPSGIGHGFIVHDNNLRRSRGLQEGRKEGRKREGAGVKHVAQRGATRQKNKVHGDEEVSTGAMEGERDGTGRDGQEGGRRQKEGLLCVARYGSTARHCSL
ncbi:hypothetical protein AXG93_1865s1330 [Marchantia polymorpha subsp. ruderalis]|uniref:Uncharacterized protein n=1 Tax=Marchantia polymorpha subsp. ruderalis TaxID=1480154 RepID=A0A176WIW4_MARPO|nr:hypothetical protein AXG93_1865s1330 [Marchantia polymorpha subsp. ruderalis]